MLLTVSLAQTLEGRWQFGIGDPTPVGWVTFAAYLLAAFLCTRAMVVSRAHALHLPSSRAEEIKDQRALAWTWFLAATLMLLLGLNKQLDLQTLLTEVGRDLAVAQGWYRGRRIVQSLFIFALSIGAGAAGLALTFALRHMLRQLLLLLCGLFSIGAYVLVRAARFNHIRVPDAHDASNLLWLLELGGIGLVCIAALRAISVPERKKG